MRYYTKPKEIVAPPHYGVTYPCKHPVYDSCTLYRIGTNGLAVIQERMEILPRYSRNIRVTIWGPIDSWLRDPIYTHPQFLEYFNKYSAPPDENGLFPTVTVRQIMWALRMKPLKKERWETVFDRCPI